jgi:hypothetical protein
MNDPNKAAQDYIISLGLEQFWGSLTLKFEGGRVVHLKQEENLKPESLSERSEQLRFSNEEIRETKR